MNEEIIFNKEKFKETLHYIIDKCGGGKTVGKVLIFKILYFSDFNYYELYEKSLTGEKYTRKPTGPTPNDFDLTIYELKNENKIKETQELVIDYIKYKYTSLIKPEIKLLTKLELELINNVINTISPMNPIQASEYSYGDLPWKVTNP